ncbi:hypothetical protein SAMN02745823_02368 [Sporobacter termitidis DSM 10068]|uniref:Uncharacterized protein n=1 Tax=Sporobacter termitidis DSM 10068 TaxID=1123282 RepID=A0A1M5YCA7_9FIRM|nr:hypothetical protein [Sporobacter termitidis]SHI09657.1 hypothetical protein SAMN02745823_02368 [Sporobacter termitidis DSM 10068]
MEVKEAQHILDQLGKNEYARVETALGPPFLKLVETIDDAPDPGDMSAPAVIPPLPAMTDINDGMACLYWQNLKSLLNGALDPEEEDDDEGPYRRGRRGRRRKKRRPWQTP